MINCRTKENRIKIFKAYKIDFITHNYNLSDIPLISCTGNKIYNDYCIFKVSGIDVDENIICGSVAYEHFAKLLNIDIPPVVYSVIQENNTKTSNNISNNLHNNKSIKWNNLTKEFYILISLFIDKYYKDLKVGTPIYNLKYNKYKYYYKDPFPNEIKSFNTILGAFNTKMVDIINSAQNKIDISHITYSSIKKIFIENYPKEKQYFD